MASLVERFVTGGGARIYRLSVQAFPALEAKVHLVLTDGQATLVDAGSGHGQSNDDLLAGFEQVRTQFGESITLAAVDRILVTHAHIDHIGGLPFVRQHCDAPIGVHELDRRVLVNYEQQLVLASANLRRFLIQAGVSEPRRRELMSMYLATKSLFRSVEVGFTYEAQGMRDGPFAFHHVPGHCPGQVMIGIDDVLLTADHVLSHTSPHQAPESITRYTGLGHYLASLRLARGLPDVQIALGGHERPIRDLPARIDAIERLHQERLGLIRDLAAEPITTANLSRGLFHTVRGYHVLLALEETGAHVEYLVERGELEIENADEIAGDDDAPIRYVRSGEPAWQPASPRADRAEVPRSEPAVPAAEAAAIAEYFQNSLPRKFEADVRPELAEVNGLDLSLQYDIDGVIYGLRVSGRRLEVVPGGLPAPLLAVHLNLADWRDSVEGRVDLGRSDLYLAANRRRLERARSLRGTLHLELTRADGSLYRSTLCYNGQPQPSVSLRMSVEDYAAMRRGELSGQTAFLDGRLKFDGDLGLLMALGSLAHAAE